MTDESSSGHAQVFLEGGITMTWYFEAILEGTKGKIIAENVPKGTKKQNHIE